MTAPLPGIVRPSLVELAIDLIEDEVRAAFNVNLAQVAEMYLNDRAQLEHVRRSVIRVGEGSCGT